MFLSKNEIVNKLKKENLELQQAVACLVSMPFLDQVENPDPACLAVEIPGEVVILVGIPVG